MSQDITVNATFEDPDTKKPVKKAVVVTLDSVPMELAARNKKIDEALANGSYRLSDPTTASMLMDLASTVGQIALDYGPSMAAIGIGSARGAAAGAPLGPAGMLGGGILGAMGGGMAGRGVTQLGHGLQGEQMEPVTDTMLKGAQTGLEAEAMGLPFRALQLRSGLSSAPHVPATQRNLTVQAAKARGIDLTTAETTGSPFFRTVESISERSLGGSSTMRKFAEKQAEQLIASGEKTGVQFGPQIDQVTRSNRFVTALQGRISDLKSEANGLFEQYIKLAGPKSPVPLDAIYKKAFEIQGDLPLFQSLRNTKLTNPSGTGILDEIQTLKGQGFTNLPLEEMRKIRTALGDIAYPDRLQGTVIVDAPVAAARRLYGSMTEALETQAASQGVGVQEALSRANQFQRNVLNNVNDSKFYSSLIDSEKSLTALSKTIFNPRDPGVLMDAKTIVSPAGWKMLQQQYWDDVFSGALTTTESGTHGFQGAKFADRLDKDKSILNVLYDADQMKEIMEFGRVARLVNRTAKLGQQNESMGVLVGGGQLAIAGHGAMNLAQGDVATAAVSGATVVAPWFAAKVFSSPTATQMMTKMVQMGRVNPNSLAELARYALRGEAIRENK